MDSLLQLSDICKMGDDLQMSSELIERALYAMESSFHPLFNLAVGTCRLDYRRQENRFVLHALAFRPTTNLARALSSLLELQFSIQSHFRYWLALRSTLLVELNGNHFNHFILTGNITQNL